MHQLVWRVETITVTVIKFALFFPGRHLLHFYKKLYLYNFCHSNFLIAMIILFYCYIS